MKIESLPIIAPQLRSVEHINLIKKLESIYNSQSTHHSQTILALHLAKNVRKNNHASLPKDLRAQPHDSQWHQNPKLACANPNCINCNSEKVIEEHKGVFDDACKKANGTVDAVAAELEVAEAT